MGSVGYEWSKAVGGEGSARSRRCRSCENLAEARILNTVSLQTEERRVCVVVFLFVWVLLWFRCPLAHTAYTALQLSRSCTRHMMNAIITVTYTPPLLFFACFTFSHADWLWMQWENLALLLSRLRKPADNAQQRAAAAPRERGRGSAHILFTERAPSLSRSLLLVVVCSYDLIAEFNHQTRQTRRDTTTRPREQTTTPTTLKSRSERATCGERQRQRQRQRRRQQKNWRNIDVSS